MLILHGLEPFWVRCQGIRSMETPTVGTSIHRCALVRERWERKRWHAPLVLRLEALSKALLFYIPDEWGASHSLNREVIVRHDVSWREGMGLHLCDMSYGQGVCRHSVSARASWGDGRCCYFCFGFDVYRFRRLRERRDRRGDGARLRHSECHFEDWHLVSLILFFFVDAPNAGLDHVEGDAR